MAGQRTGTGGGAVSSDKRDRREYMRAYNARNRERRAAVDKARYERNKAAIIARVAKYQKEHPIKRARWQKAYKGRNLAALRAKDRARARRYRAANLERIRAKDRRRMAERKRRRSAEKAERIARLVKRAQMAARYGIIHAGNRNP